MPLQLGGRPGPGPGPQPQQQQGPGAGGMGGYLAHVNDFLPTCELELARAACLCPESSQVPRRHFGRTRTENGEPESGAGSAAVTQNNARRARSENPFSLPVALTHTAATQIRCA
jgi:hypothetical protein